MVFLSSSFFLLSRVIFAQINFWNDRFLSMAVCIPAGTRACK